MNTETLTHLVLTYRYWILLPLAILEGPVLALFVGIFVKLRYFSLVPAFLVMIVADFIPDSFYYYAGRSGHEWNFLKKHLAKLNDKSLIIKLWHKHTIKTLFMSKLAFGLSPALLVTAGVAKVPYKNYISWALVITVLQYGIFIAVGYWVGYSYDFLQNVKYFGIFIACAVILFVAFHGVIKKIARRKIREMENEAK